jgi:hypothetical protein
LFLGIAKDKFEKVYLPLHLHRLSLFIRVVCCVAGILDTDIGKTLMNMEMLKFLRARANIGFIVGINWDLLPVFFGYAITIPTVESLSTVVLLPSY